MNLEPIIIIQSEISQIEKNKYMIKKQISYINAYTWNLEKWYWWIYLQGRNRGAEIENTFVDTVGEREGGMNEKATLKHIYYHVRQITNDGKLL